MKKSKMKYTPILISAVFFLNGSFVAAQSVHDHSHMNKEWVFSQKIERKIESVLAINPAERAIGLTAMGKKVMDNYGLKVGRTFDAKVNDATWRFGRTTTGLKVIKRISHRKINLYGSVPVNKTVQIVTIAWSRPSHSGHNHSHFPYEWVFTRKIQKKIKNNTQKGNFNSMIGLSRFAQKKLDQYGIKLGATFVTRAHNSPFMVKRMSSGIKILDIIETDEVALLPNGNRMF